MDPIYQRPFLAVSILYLLDLTIDFVIIYLVSPESNYHKLKFTWQNAIIHVALYAWIDYLG